MPFSSTLALKRQGGGDTSCLQLFLNVFGVAVVFCLFDLLLLDKMRYKVYDALLPERDYEELAARGVDGFKVLSI